MYHTFPTADEIGHLPAGVSHWKYGRFDLYRVNPPLVRMICTGFVTDSEQYDWTLYSTLSGRRPEFSIGLDRLHRAGLEIVNDYTLPRLTGLSLTAFGLIVGVVWLTQCFGKTVVPILFAAYWAFSPDLLAHGATIGPDVGATGCGLMASYLYWRYSQFPSASSAILAGIGLGFAVFSKLTWLTGLLSLPVAMMLHALLSKNRDASFTFIVLVRDLLLSTLVAFLVVNMGYGLEGTMTPLGKFQFCSKMLGGKDASRFTPNNAVEPSSMWSSLPIPLPRNFVLGIDFLKAEVEEKKWSFLMGKWQHGSWPHYYVLTTLFKTPEPTLIAALMGFCVLLIGIRRNLVDAKVTAMFLFLGIPSVVAFASVSLQGGFNHHHRYVLPIYPFLFSLAAFVASPTARQVLCSRFPCIGPNRRSIAVPMGATLCILMIGSTLRVHPYYTSYFNTISGGPDHGWRLLGYSNIDWGQDIQLVDRWIRQHPECRPLKIDLGDFGFSRDLFEIPSTSPPMLPKGGSIEDVRTDETQWWIISVTKLYNLPGRDGLEYLQQIEPLEKIAYSYHVYRIAPKMPAIEGPIGVDHKSGLNKMLPFENHAADMFEGARM